MILPLSFSRKCDREIGTGKSGQGWGAAGSRVPGWCFLGENGEDLECIIVQLDDVGEGLVGKENMILAVFAGDFLSSFRPFFRKTLPFIPPLSFQNNPRTYLTSLPPCASSFSSRLNSRSLIFHRPSVSWSISLPSHSFLGGFYLPRRYASDTLNDGARSVESSLHFSNPSNPLISILGAPSFSVSLAYLLGK